MPGIHLAGSFMNHPGARDHPPEAAERIRVPVVSRAVAGGEFS